MNSQCEMRKKEFVQDVAISANNCKQLLKSTTISTVIAEIKIMYIDSVFSDTPHTRTHTHILAFRFHSLPLRLRSGSTMSRDSSSCESEIIGSPVLDSSPATSPFGGVELTDDVIICGRCKLRFTTASQLVEHRRSAECRLRFACRCREFGLHRQRSNSSTSGQNDIECFWE